ncbi:MAG: TIGR03915 family putative DNA repair protein [Chitinophagaceae bacterium]|nr:TIGR03915 family putative DNA repair protein [Chitinophagaceae bacterium]
MTVLVYDGSLGGLLTAIFDIYEYKLSDASVRKAEETSYSLFGQTRTIHTDEEKAQRVWKKLEDKLSRPALGQFYKTYLSELPGIEDPLIRYVRYVLSAKGSVENDYSHPDVLTVQQTSRKVHREKHRMEAFVRFQLTKDRLYYSIIQPDFNVLPLIRKHFTDRYADQKWLIYDSRRKYGLFYNLEVVEEVEMEFAINTADPSQVAHLLDEKEELWQKLWQQYFTSVNIPARKNMKLHIKHMPKRYWKFLPEKQPVKDNRIDPPAAA